MAFSEENEDLVHWESYDFLILYDEVFYKRDQKIGNWKDFFTNRDNVNVIFNRASCTPFKIRSFFLKYQRA